MPEPGPVIGLFVRFDLRDEQSVVRFDELTAAAVAAIAAAEPGTLVYATSAVRDEPLARVFYEIYADEAAFQAHEHAPHVLDFHARKNPLLAREPRVEFFTPGPGTGLPHTTLPREGGPE
jgi:quinol monooxygenase YgiN